MMTSPSQKPTIREVAGADVSEAAAVLRLLGHPDRLRLVGLMLEETRPVGELAEDVGLAPNAVSQHLGLMESRGIVERTRKGRRVYYRVISKVARNLMRCLLSGQIRGR
ncbi:MAG: ArsR/SmtB family transcription factor [Phycisphaerae bacterium]